MNLSDGDLRVGLDQTGYQVGAVAHWRLRTINFTFLHNCTLIRRIVTQVVPEWRQILRE